MAQLSLNNICKDYGNGCLAVNQANLEVHDGEFVVLVGPSGCGKSTLLNMIAGLEDITSGTLKINNRVVNTLPSKDRDIAMVFQNYALYPHMTVYKNMAFSLSLRKVQKAEIDRRVQDAARILDIRHLLERLPRELSGGQRQRVAIGRAIVRQPSIFLFDEPLSNLDAKLRVQMRVEIRDLHHRLGVTAIYVTHDQTEAMTMGDRIVVMKDGVIQQMDRPMEIYNNPANRFVAGFIGSPAMNFFEGMLVHTDRGWAFHQSEGIHLALPDAYKDFAQHTGPVPLTLGLRPEMIGCSQAWQQRDAPRLHGKIRVVEPLGAETYLYCETGQAHWIARVEQGSWTVGQEVALPVLIDRLHFFDGRTQVSLPLHRHSGLSAQMGIYA
ncbi:MAG TPA: sn-glycerol-3-phosphate ABC transporter ATP-binding protein UgpC [Oligoflexus sp.]|uniref:ABC transporter ATP-binding protein n=1 Tax=Oligoflexus sp. TaxID=1971216 RepID=UPI002D444264|nr:sn-glycerol-3-phosphate ABC transporter ATP-binding protein UgpC [Oligoflexus sp.]HYX36417.1 sn-glycerol-3-phosphate ABC transporter ATP-binding protein UgpC [Oligoflexus sp.]